MSAVLSSMIFAGGNIAPVEAVEAPVAADNSGLYVGLGYSRITLDNVASSGESDVDWNGATLIAGYQFNENVAVEARYTSNVGEATDHDHGSSDYSEYDEMDFTTLGVFAKGMYPVGKFTPYALLGLVEATADFTPEGGSKHTDLGFALGLGASYEVMDQVDLFVDYIFNSNGFTESDNWREGDSRSAIWTAGFTYKF